MLVVFLNRSVRVDVCLLDSGARGRKSIADRGTEIDIESATRTNLLLLLLHNCVRSGGYSKVDIG